jgi:RNA polymerase sigma-70 factor (ECF subfamily)
LDKDGHRNEHDLIRGLKNGSHRAFDDIYRLYARRLYAFCLSFTKSREEAEEIVQDVFVKLWTNRSSIRQDETLRPLLFIIARHQLINAYRSGLNHPMYEEYVNCREAISTDDAHRRLEYEEFLHRFHAALNRLPLTRQQVVRLSKIDGLSNKEIAEMLSLSEQTVKNQLSLGLKALRDILGAAALQVMLLFLNQHI